MKKSLLRRTLVLLFTAAALVACNDDDPVTGGIDEVDSSFNATYSSANLDLSYSGSPMPGKSVSFAMTGDRSGRLTLTDIFMDAERLVIDGIPLYENGGGYSFSGYTATPQGTTFRYAGTLTPSSGEENPSMKLDLTDIKVPANYLSSHGAFKIINCLDPEDIFISSSTSGFWTSRYYNRLNSLAPMMWWTYGDDEDMLLYIPLVSSLMDLNGMLHEFLGKLLYLVLDDVTFHPDGTVTASYCPVPDGYDIAGLFSSSVSESDRSKSIESPANLLQYRIDGEYVYIKPNLQMLLELIGLDLGGLIPTRSDEGDEGDEENEDQDAGLDIGQIISDLLSLINRWTTDGIRFNLVSNDTTRSYYRTSEIGLLVTNYYDMCYNGDYKLFLDTYELGDIVQNLKMYLDMFGLDLSNIEIAGFNIGPYLDPVFENTADTRTLELGLYLYDTID